MACDKIDKMKSKDKSEAISPRPTSLTTEPQSSPPSAGDDTMKPTSGPPTPNGVGGPTPPPVSRGREEDGKTMKPTSGPPTPNGMGGPTPPPKSRERDGEGKKEGGGQAESTKAPTRRPHTSRELRMLDPSENPLSKRARRPTRGVEAVDNSCEATRESSMICPIKCGCRNSLVDIMEKTRVVSHILRATRKIWENELIACFGLTAAITNKDEISELKQAQQERNSDLYQTSIQYTVQGSIHGKEVCLVPPPGRVSNSKGPDKYKLTEKLETTQ